MVRLDAHHKLLKSYVIECMAALSSSSPTSPQATTFVREVWQAFQSMINHWFGRLPDTASINSKKAHFPMGGIKVRKSPHAEFTRFQWTMPRALAT